MKNTTGDCQAREKKPDELLDKLEEIACRLETVAEELTNRVTELRREAREDSGIKTLHRTADDG